MTFFQEVYDRIRCATNARTQTELAAVLEIRQSSISDAKRRNSIPFRLVHETVRKVRAQPRLDQERHRPDVPEDRSGIHAGRRPPEGFHEEPAHYADPNAISTLTKVYSTQCAYEEGHPAPDLQTSGKIALPQSYVNAQTLVFHIESDSFSPLVRRGAYVGVDTSRTHPISGEVYAVYMPHEGVALKRLFLDGDHGPFHPEDGTARPPRRALLPQDCPGRILGRVSWVLQNV